MPSHPGRNAGARPQDVAKQQLEEWRAKYRDDLDRQMAQMPSAPSAAYASPAPAAAAPSPSNAAFMPAPAGMGRKVSDPSTVNEFVVRQQEARRNAQRYKADYDLGPVPERMVSPPNPGRDHGRLPDIGAPPSRMENLSDSKKLAAARQDYFERQQAARRNAVKISDDLDRPSVPASAGGDDLLDRAQAVRAQRDKERERERMQQEAKLAAARRQAFEERAAIMKKRNDDGPAAAAPPPAPSSMESTIVLSRGKAMGIVSQVDRVKEQRGAAKEQERMSRERELADARRVAFEERQALKARIDRELQQDSMVA